MFCDRCSRDILPAPRNVGREIRLVFDSGVEIKPGADCTIMVRSRITFRPSRIVIVQSFESFLIKNFLVGNNCQYWEGTRQEIPGHVFQPMAHPVFCRYDTAMVDWNLAFEVKNIGDKPVRFIAHLSGTAIEI